MEKKDLILELLEKKPLSFKEIQRELFKKLSVQNRELDLILNELKRDNKIYFKRREDKYYLKNEESVIGIFKETRFQYGFVEVEDKTYFIPERFTSTALSNDTVKIVLFPLRDKDKPDRRSGKIVRIVKRNGNNIIVRVKKDKTNKLVILPDEESRFSFALTNKENYKENTILVTRFQNIFEKIVYLDVLKILGDESDAKIDYLVLAYKNNIKLKFSNEAIIEAKKFDVFKNKERIDYRNLLTYTIDGESSKDLDDAISIEKEKDGFILYVHIADVSNFVREESVLDYEAYKRCNSIYLIDQVFPMLPEILSNQLCSLNPNVDRLALTCKMFINRAGKVIKYQIDNSIINSNFRLTYEEIDVFFDNKKEILRNDENLTKSILYAKELSQIIRNNKLKNGMIDFNLPETKIDLDKNGEPIRIWNKFQSVSEKIIEDLMVITNQSVANFLIHNHIKGIFRIHDKPKQASIESFLLLLKTLVSQPIDSSEKINQHWFSRFLNVIKGEDYELIVKRNMIQTMEKAIYSNKNSGHYALGLGEYLHFTSPIRRYADLIVHRNIKKFLKDKSYFKDEHDNELESIALECSKKERDAANIERKLKDIKKVRYLEKHRNESFDAIIISFTKIGMYVEIDGLIQGIVKYSSFLNSEYSYEENNYYVSIIKDKKEERYELGKKVKVKISDLSLVRGQVDFDII
ncbi:MAG: ribonuclease R [Candidatus Hepatoplasma vulgare]|nr:MAG: ribonuclease R [Candidatus Hepatoplasma sp.]